MKKLLGIVLALVMMFGVVGSSGYLEGGLSFTGVGLEPYLERIHEVKTYADGDDVGPCTG